MSDGADYDVGDVAANIRRLSGWESSPELCILVNGRP